MKFSGGFRNSAPCVSALFPAGRKTAPFFRQPDADFASRTIAPQNQFDDAFLKTALFLIQSCAILRLRTARSEVFMGVQFTGN
jgi:hypothetical protein